MAPVMSRAPPLRPRPPETSSRDNGLPRRLCETNSNAARLCSSTPLRERDGGGRERGGERDRDKGREKERGGRERERGTVTKRTI